MLIKKIVYFIFIVISLFIINELVHSIYGLWQKQSLIDESRQALNFEKKKNIDLKNRLKVVNQPQFIEQEARNKLFLVRPGEGIVVIAPTEYLKASRSAGEKSLDTRPNWLKWWEVFF